MPPRPAPWPTPRTAASSSMAVDGAGIREQAAGGISHELVVRAVRVKHHFQDAIGGVVVHNAVRLNREEAGEERAARSRDDLRDAGRIWLAGRILRCEALV